VVEDVELPRSIELTTYGGAEPDMHVTVELRDGSPVLTGLSWTSGAGQNEIRQKHLRQTDVAKLVTDLVVSTMKRQDDSALPPLPTDEAHDVMVKMLRERKQLAKQAEVAARRFVERQRLPRERRVMTDEFLRNVAEVYRANIDAAPTKAVGATFGVQPRMASKYVDKARQKGYWPATLRGQKKAYEAAMANANGEGSIYKRMRDGRHVGYIGAVSYRDESGKLKRHGVCQDPN
jgi:hypothetical protein